MLILFVILSIPVFSQGYKEYDIQGKTDKEQISESVIIDNYIERYSHLKNPEEYLIASRRSKYISWASVTVATGIFALNSINDKPDNILNITSGVLAMASMVFEIRSVILIGTAGKAMKLERYRDKSKQISLYANPQSAGIKLTF